ncbi:hypothetical protein BU24DRAFT_428891 [Aaosphaeria arxii CBS 175.79]|uniref:LysM domain-containing protein n=1 Tax=Aaosphaeria arxii CBS 175.79 TaxID=1450172 RepID=A0A6A5X7K3_9PLEO|nr:uncharacterized protein BU24DRAFT_428891 [Aaosphaeria arxii CBS 175.79]KAF2008901.1 hypothetical protein BU24DRAFT_428891 [Aaosphaeria arxii CBS 175.79]
MSSEACCTCAALLSSIPPTYDEKTEKPSRYERRLECCHRAVCARCITDNPRFATYCPFCQVSIVPSSLPQGLLPQGLRDPPAYSPPSGSETVEGITDTDGLPPYTTHSSLDNGRIIPPKSSVEKAADVLHFVDHDLDSVASLSLRYNVPADALRRTNGLYADHLLAARRTVLIPGEFYKGGVSLSPTPLESEEEEIRKGKVRKFMVGCKVADLAPRYRYDMALMYLQQADYNLDAAIEAFKADERWEQKHPLEAARKGKSSNSVQGVGKWRWAFGGSGGGLTGQLT